MKKVLIMCASDPQTDPRPNRMIHWLKDEYAVTVLGLKRVKIKGVESIGAPGFETHGFALGVLRKGLTLLGLLFVHLGLRVMAVSLWSNLHAPVDRYTSSSTLKDSLHRRAFHLIVSHDLVLLPLAFRVRNTSKVLLDAREYYPRHYEDRPLWRLLRQPMMDHLSTLYLQRCDRITTVSERIATEYHKIYGVQPRVILSLPYFHDLTPSPVRNENVRIIYHGSVSLSRHLEQMIYVMDYVDKRFSLDLMLIPQKSSYWQILTNMVRKRKNVRIIPPVPMSEIISFTNNYDIGLFLCKPVTFNLAYAMPNKLFEFIQARLAVAIGPSPEMRKIVEKYQCGFVSSDFGPETMADALNELTLEKIMYYKERSHRASYELSAEVNAEKVRHIVRELVGS